MWTGNKRPFDGACLGILGMDTAFARPPGDVGNARTWPFPVQYRRVADSTVSAVVTGRGEGLFEAFAAAAEDLVAHGADGIATTCGFLVLYQEQLTRRLPVPVASSSLLQIPMVESLLPAGRRVGVITFSAADLGGEHFRAAGAPEDTPCVGVPADGAFHRTIADDLETADPAAMRADVLAAGERLLNAHPDIGAIVLECANMPPYAAALREASGLPVFDVYSFLTWFHAGLRPRRW